MIAITMFLSPYPFHGIILTDASATPVSAATVADKSKACPASGCFNAPPNCTQS